MQYSTIVEKSCSNKNVIFICFY